MKIGSLVKYNNKYTTEFLVGIVLEIDTDSDNLSPYRVRWADHTDSQRNWYDLEELILL